MTKVRVIENESAVNVTSSGSVDEYKIEVLINFEIFDISNDVMLLHHNQEALQIMMYLIQNILIHLLKKKHLNEL